MKKRPDLYLRRLSDLAGGRLSSVKCNNPGPSRWHQKISSALMRPILIYLQGHTCRVYTAPFEVLLPAFEEESDEVTTVVQPDISVICDRCSAVIDPTRPALNPAFGIP